MMSRNTFMICQCRHAPLGHFIHIAQVGEENSGPAAVHGWDLVIRACRSCFLKLGNAMHFNFRAWSSEKEFLRRALRGLLDQFSVPGQRLRTTLVVVGIEKTRVFRKLV